MYTLQNVEQGGNAMDYLKKSDAVDRFDEEVATELSPSFRDEREHRRVTATTGRMLGFSALGLAILSLFAFPVLLGAGAITLGFLARSRGSENLGAWAIVIGTVTIVVRLLVMPFF